MAAPTSLVPHGGVRIHRDSLQRSLPVDGLCRTNHAIVSDGKDGLTRLGLLNGRREARYRARVPVWLPKAAR